MPTSPIRKQRTATISPEDRARLLELAAPDAHDESVRLRARIILSWLSGATGDQTADLLGTSRRTVSKWRSRFRNGGVEGLWDRPRPGAPRTIPAVKIDELVRLRQSPPPGGKPRWTTRMLARHTGLSQSTVVRIARMHPDLMR